MISTEAGEIITRLDNERLRALQPNYVPPRPNIAGWLDLLHKKSSSISHDAVKKRACHYIESITRHSEMLFMLCALSMSWSRLGAIKKPEEISKILTWWDGVEHPSNFPSLSGISVNRAQGLDTHPGNIPTESDETFVSHEGDIPCTSAPRSTFQNSVKRLLKALDGFDKSTKELLENIHLSTLDEISEEVISLWEHAHTTYPRLFQSEKCLGDKPPTDAALFLATMKMISESTSNSNPPYTAFCRGEVDGVVDPSIALSQLWSPDPTMPVSLVGFNLPDILPKSIFRTPEEMSLYIEPFEESNQQLLLTPTYCKTDLHIDPSEGLSLSFGSKKLFLLFPGTKHNLDVLRKAEGQKEKLARIGRHLEGGLITDLTPSHAIHIPLGSIHSVLTTSGGFLMTLDFIAPTSAKAYSGLLSTGHDRVDGRRYQKVYFDRFLSSIELALDNNQVQLAIDSWVKSHDRIEEWAGGHAIWSRKATKIWHRFLQSPESKNILCPCGEMGQNSFQRHFKRHYSVRTSLRTRNSLGA